MRAQARARSVPRAREIKAMGRVNVAIFILKSPVPEENMLFIRAVAIPASKSPAAEPRMPIIQPSQRKRAAMLFLPAPRERRMAISAARSPTDT